MFTNYNEPVVTNYHSANQLKTKSRGSTSLTPMHK